MTELEQARLLRRAKREERRAKQRVANVGRAAKMRAARLEFEATSTSAAKMAELKTGVLKTAVHVGCSGWFYWHWREQFYPATLPSNQWFSHYAKNFKTVELNAPFYSWPTIHNVQTWLKQAGRRQFVYTVKACELITHVKRFRGTKKMIEDFGHIADLLGPRMGCFLFQLPPSHRYTPARLKSIVSQFDVRRRNVVEFRHKSWWNERVYEAFRERGIIFCSCSGPRLPDELVKTADEIYVRFHGTKNWYRHDYSKAELQIWADRIRDSGATRVWAYFNNDRDCYAIKNAQMLRGLLKGMGAGAKPQAAEEGSI